MGPEVVAAAALGGLALDAGSKIVGAQGEKAGQDFMAARDARAAELGKLRATQTDTGLTEELNTALANIDSIRAAANIDPTSPTTAAIKANETGVSDRARQTKVASILAQSDEDAASSQYRYSAGKTALLGGYLSAGAKVAGGIGRAYAKGG